MHEMDVHARGLLGRDVSEARAIVRVDDRRVRADQHLDAHASRRPRDDVPQILREIVVEHRAHRVDVEAEAEARGALAFDALEVHRQPGRELARLATREQLRDERLARREYAAHLREQRDDAQRALGARRIRPRAWRRVDDDEPMQLAVHRARIRHRDLAAVAVPDDRVDAHLDRLREAHEILRRRLERMRRWKAARLTVVAQIDEERTPARVRRDHALDQRAPIRLRAEDAVQHEHPALWIRHAAFVDAVVGELAGR